MKTFRQMALLSFMVLVSTGQADAANEFTSSRADAASGKPVTSVLPGQVPGGSVILKMGNETALTEESRGRLRSPIPRWLRSLDTGKPERYGSLYKRDLYLRYVVVDMRGNYLGPAQCWQLVYGGRPRKRWQLSKAAERRCLRTAINARTWKTKGNNKKGSSWIPFFPRPALY